MSNTDCHAVLANHGVIVTHGDTVLTGCAGSSIVITAIARCTVAITITGFFFFSRFYTENVSDTNCQGIISPLIDLVLIARRVTVLAMDNVLMAIGPCVGSGTGLFVAAFAAGLFTCVRAGAVVGCTSAVTGTSLTISFSSSFEAHNFVISTNCIAGNIVFLILLIQNKTGNFAFGSVFQILFRSTFITIWHQVDTRICPIWKYNCGC